MELGSVTLKINNQHTRDVVRPESLSLREKNGTIPCDAQKGRSPETGCVSGKNAERSRKSKQVLQLLVAHRTRHRTSEVLTVKSDWPIIIMIIGKNTISRKINH